MYVGDDLDTRIIMDTSEACEVVRRLVSIPEQTGAAWCAYLSSYVSDRLLNDALVLSSDTDIAEMVQRLGKKFFYDDGTMEVLILAASHRFCETHNFARSGNYILLDSIDSVDLYGDELSEILAESFEKKMAETLKVDFETYDRAAYETIDSEQTAAAKELLKKYPGLPVFTIAVDIYLSKVIKDFNEDVCLECVRDDLDKFQELFDELQDEIQGDEQGDPPITE